MVGSCQPWAGGPGLCQKTAYVPEKASEKAAVLVSSSAAPALLLGDGRWTAAGKRKRNEHFLLLSRLGGRGSLK